MLYSKIRNPEILVAANWNDSPYHKYSDFNFFLNYKLYNIQEFLSELFVTLFKDKIISRRFYQTLYGNLNNHEEIIRILYHRIGEEKIKNYIAQYFNLTHQIIEFNNLYLCDNKIMLMAQKYHFIPQYIDDNALYVIIDYLNEETHQFLLINYQVKNIHYSFAAKQTIINFLNHIYQKELTAHALNSKNLIASAKNLNFNFFSIISLVIFLLVFSFSAQIPVIYIIIICNIFYLSSCFFKLFLSLSKGDIVTPNLKYNKIINQFNFPIYTILLPIYNEGQTTILQLIAAIQNLNYPHHQLDVQIIIEEDDQKTIEALFDIELNYIFTIIKVPNCSPKTKAKACNYAFNFIRGQFLVIYDADDIPARNQIYHAFKAFQKDKNLSCVQCLLNSYNNQENLLTKFYSIEFSLWYKIFLPNIQKWKMPVTFGGTSNHFTTKALASNLWDAYNVTEDADLGVRWWFYNFKSVIIHSTTLEEAPIKIRPWINQRSRWIKGFIQTYFVHKIQLKELDSLNQKIKFMGWLNLFVLIPIIAQASFLLVISEFLILKYFFKADLISQNLTIFTSICFCISYIAQITPIIIHRKKFLFKISFNILLFPIYSMLNIIATLKAIFQFVTNPYYWEKTIHGVSLNKIKK